MRLEKRGQREVTALLESQRRCSDVRKQKMRSKCLPVLPRACVTSCQQGNICYRAANVSVSSVHFTINMFFDIC